MADKNRIRQFGTFAMVGVSAMSAGILLAATANEPTAAVPVELTNTEAFIAGAPVSGGRRASGQDFPSFDQVSKGFTKVVSTADGKKGMYTLYTNAKDSEVLAELPRDYASKKVFLAYTIAGGVPESGVQGGDLYAYWKRFGNRLALVQPNYGVRTTGDDESRTGLRRVHTDRVITDVPIVTTGPGGGPVINLTDLLVGRSSLFFGSRTVGANTRLAKIAKAKSFPKNVELAFEMPLAGGQFGTIYYSLAELPESTGYKPRAADERVGYFTTTHRDIGDVTADDPWVRYINRWKLEKADPSLRMSPPKEPIVFYLENTVPVRYRRWVRDGVLEWNKAFEEVGIINAIEVYQQDARTGAHMEKDPEDARYNYVLWTNGDMGFAIGPSRVHPKTGQILDADIVMDEGFLTGWVKTWEDMVPQAVMEGFGPETLAWLAEHPDYDPRILLASPARRQDVRRALKSQYAKQEALAFAGHPAASIDQQLIGDDNFDGLGCRISQVNGSCQHAAVKAMDMALVRLDAELIARKLQDKKKPGKKKQKTKADDAEETSADETAKADEEDTDKEAAPTAPEPKEEEVEIIMLDGVPEEFIGPLLKEVIMHEVGHTLGLRHNFKASTIYDVSEMNSSELQGQALSGSVMDYLPVNINMDDGPEQGDFTMVTIGPYDYWAIEYGYGNGNPKEVASRGTEPMLVYGTDEDAWGPDPRARRFDLGKNPLDYADSQMRLVQELRGQILDRMVKDGESWAEARKAYDMLLRRHTQAISTASNWVGGTYVHRNKKGDPNEVDPIIPVEADQQRRALQFMMDNSFSDEAYGLSPELLRKMTLDRWYDEGGMSQLFDDPPYPVHDRIGSIQGATLSMLLNPGTLNRVYDNEFRLPAEEDTLTLPEIIGQVSQNAWSEVYDVPRGDFSERKPMISSLRRNLQRRHLERMVDLAMPGGLSGPAAQPISNLSRMQLLELQGKIRRAEGRAGIDAYTQAHLAQADEIIERVMNAQHIYNTDDIGGGGGGMMFFQMHEGAETP